MPAKYSNSTPAARSSAASGSAPIKTLRLGRLKAAVWENTSEQRAFFNVTFARTYLDGEKKFRDTDSFGRDDLLLLAKLADQAHTFICDQMAAARNEESPAERGRRG